MQRQLLPKPAVAELPAGQTARYQAALLQQLAPSKAYGAALVSATLPAAADRLPAQGACAGLQPHQQRPQQRQAPEAAGLCVTPPPKRVKRGGGGADGMAFFLQMQRGQAGAGGASPAVGGAASNDSSGEATAEALEVHQQQGSLTVHSVELPAAHTHLLRLLRDDEARLVRSTPAPAPPEFARSDFLSAAALQPALERAAGGQVGAAW